MERLIPTRRMHAGAPLLLRMHGIGTDDASFYQGGMHQSGGGTHLIFAASDGSLRQDNATLTLIEGEQMHRRLSFFAMAQGSPYRFAIHRDMRQGLGWLVGL